MPSLLVVDDEPNVLYSVEQVLRSDDLDVITAATGRQGIELVQQQRPDAVLLDVRLSDMSGLDAFDQIRRIDPRLPVIIITAFAATETAIEAMKRGAFEYLLKPVDFHQLREVVARAIELSRLTHVPAVFHEQGEAATGVDRIVGRSSVMQGVYKAIGRMAPQDVTVLILGESGTGKELVARALYHHSRRADRPFLAINCAAIPESLLESELFGHERGAFTGADRRRVGKFEQADGGTIFLDEIGDMTSTTQAKVLRLLQEQRFERLGSNETIQTDVRVIAATNQDLEQAVAAGRFRRDLFYRLNGFTIRLPPLRERREDLPLLVEHFIQHFNARMGRQVRSVSPETLQLLQEHDWPGNVRELQSTIKYALVHAAGDVLTPDCLPENLRAAAGTARPPQPVPDSHPLDLVQFVNQLIQAGETEIYRKVCLAADRVILDTVLRHARGSQVQASELLGISRTTLRAKLRALGMTVEKQLLPDSDQAG
ncbi:MAG TPA: sigma-54 dependent transcriptional regulator [Gemmataceae bacterium]|nr:sigma-54 dependent transcriptional regulator [Gemmataceae bacterium]